MAAFATEGARAIASRPSVAKALARAGTGPAAPRRGARARVGREDVVEVMRDREEGAAERRM